MERPSISLNCILKNELKNIPRLLASTRDCFDEIHLTDTGSTDGSIELIESYIKHGANPANTPISLHHFEWCDDFARARNHSFSFAKTDYLMWLDLDDALKNPQAFIEWRDSVMRLADFWLATYHYALDGNFNPKCSFARERVVRRSLKFEWKYFVHEGVLPESPIKKNVVMQYAQTWAVNHMRDAEDIKVDRSRNLKIFDRHRAQLDLDPRMRYYYGKELYENSKPLEAFQELMNAVANNDLQIHDRVMGLQYAVMAAMQLNQFEKAIQLAHQGLQLDPNRAEFFVFIGDCYLRVGKTLEALAFYNAATSCRFQGDSKVQGAIFAAGDAYGVYPFNQMAKVYANLGDMDRGEHLAGEALKRGENEESRGIIRDIQMIKKKVGDNKQARPRVRDIVISCPPGGLYEWDGDIYRQKGIGGSETAAVEMAEWFAKLTGRRIIIFNRKEGPVKTINGVDYAPTADLPEYFRDHSPAAHIAWRHCTRLSPDPIYTWSHDLASIGYERGEFHRILALSEFHRGFMRNLLGIPDEKIIVTRNGIDPKRFMKPRTPKEFGKIIYSSSPDRGLLSAIKVMDEVVKVIPGAKLHCFYGFDNMIKMGLGAQAEEIQRAMAGKPHIVFHGNVPQSELTREFETACVWLYPTNFLETFCITAIEALCSKVYPVVRAWGALPDTLASAKAHGSADVLDRECESEEDVRFYALHVVHALQEDRWERIAVDPNHFSWQSVAEEWLKIFGIEATHAKRHARTVS